MGARMTDVYIVTLVLIGILISFPGLAVALNLLLPKATHSAYKRVSQTPLAAFAVGAVITAGVALWVAVLVNVNAAPIKAVGFITALLALGVASIGAAGLARLMGERIAGLTGDGEVSGMAYMVRGAVIYELACLVPFVGWFLFAPLTGIMVMGASVFGLLGWSPREKAAQQAPEPEYPAYDDGHVDDLRLQTQ